MGQHSSAYLTYGLQLPAHTDLAAVDTALTGNTSGVGYLEAGPHDHDSLYLVTYCENADVCTPKTLDTPEQHPDWDRILDHALELLGISTTAVDAPAWLLIADVS